MLENFSFGRIKIWNIKDFINKLINFVLSIKGFIKEAKDCLEPSDEKR